MKFLLRNNILVFLCFLLLVGLIFTREIYAFPARIGEDCFYGDGENPGDGISTWMGYSIEFDPPYTPYTVDAISIYINQMWFTGNSPRMWIAVLDENGILVQKKDLLWTELANHRGWVLIPLTPAEYQEKFTVIVSPGIGISATGSAVSPKAGFSLGFDQSCNESYSYVYTSDTSPPPPPMGGMNIRTQLDNQSRQNLSKLTPANKALQSAKNGNFMIRAHSPGLQMESPRIVITQDDLDRFIAKRNGTFEIPQPTAEWRLPPLDRIGPRNTVHCPTSLAGVTFYYHQASRGRKFIIPHDGPWANPDLVAALGALCQDLAKEGIVGIEHIGIYNDRNIAGTNTKSSHAYGLGIDISGFQYADGRVIMVEDHDDPDVRAILTRIRDEYLKKYFSTVLDWTYQRHDNHFHVNLPYNP